MPKGHKTLKVQAWEELGEWFCNTGARKYLEYIETLDGEEFARRFEAMLEYFKPKLSRTEGRYDITNLNDARSAAFDQMEQEPPVS